MSTKLREELAKTRELLQLAAHRRDHAELERLLVVCEELDALIQLEEGDTSYGVSALTAQDIHDHWLEEQRLDPGASTEPHIGALTNDIQRPKPPHWSYPIIMGFISGLIIVLMAFIGLFLD